MRAKYFLRFFASAMLLGTTAVNSPSQESRPPDKNAILAANQKAEAENAAIKKVFAEGNAALVAGDYDKAIAIFDNGINGYPDHPGTPTLLTNKARTLIARATKRFNAAITASDEFAKSSGKEAAKQDVRAAVESSSKAISVLKASPQSIDPATTNAVKLNLVAALSTRAEAMLLSVRLGDSSQADAAFSACQEYIAAETDPERKRKGQISAAKMLLDSGQIEKALTEFRSILSKAPDNLAANFGAGMALLTIGDKANYQQAANYLKHFVDLAPDVHPNKADARDMLAYLKESEKIVPKN